MSKIPELEHHCGSWIITSKETGKVAFETFVKETAEKVNQDNYLVETANQYLVRFAKEANGAYKC